MSFLVANASRFLHTDAYILHIKSSGNNGKIINFLSEKFGRFSVYLPPGSALEKFFLYESKLALDLYVHPSYKTYVIHDVEFVQQYHSISGIASLFAVYAREICYKYSLELAFDQQSYADYDHFCNELLAINRANYPAPVSYDLCKKAVYRFELNLFATAGTIDYLDPEYAYLNFREEQMYVMSANCFVEQSTTNPELSTEAFSGEELHALADRDLEIMEIKRVTLFIHLLRANLFNNPQNILSEQLLADIYQLI